MNATLLSAMREDCFYVANFILAVPSTSCWTEMMDLTVTGQGLKDAAEE
jgi:hypothetical protein